MNSNEYHFNESVNMIKVDSVSKSFMSGESNLTVLKNVSFEIQKGEFISILGPSGSGKSTLLGLLAGLDRPSTGSVSLNNQNLNSLSEDKLSIFRNLHVGFVFQSFQLIPTLTALENVMVPLELQNRKDAQKNAESLLEKVGLASRKNHYPIQLSGGEQQRVAIARAFSNQPLILFADEPTGNLDQKTGHKILDLMLELNRNEQTTLVMVTHDLNLAQLSQRIIKLSDGELVSDEKVNSAVTA